MSLLLFPKTDEHRPRSRARRRRDTEHRLTHDVDVWVASASADGAPYLVPLSFDWDREALLVATPTDSPTGRNLAATRVVRLGLGHTGMPQALASDDLRQSAPLPARSRIPREAGTSHVRFSGLKKQCWGPSRDQVRRENNCHQRV